MNENILFWIVVLCNILLCVILSFDRYLWSEIEAEQRALSDSFINYVENNDCFCERTLGDDE